jgi:hypothetical protein
MAKTNVCKRSCPNDRPARELRQVSSQISSTGSRLQPESNSTSIGAPLGKLCDRENTEFGDAKKPACADLVVFDKIRATALGQL